MALLKKRMFQLDARLNACAGFVRQDCKLADIGTDHAYLPIYLAKNGKISKAIAADVNVAPLQKAAMHIRKYQVEDIVQTRLSNGLEVIFPNEADDIVIAGMGGELILQIIDQALWLKQREKHLILQPMTGEEELRYYLANHGFYVLKEKAAVADEKVYSAMLVIYDPSRKNESPLFPYIGVLQGETPEDQAYFQRQIRFFRKKAEGLRRGNHLAEAEAAEALVHQLEAVLSAGKEKTSCEQ